MTIALAQAITQGGVTSATSATFSFLNATTPGNLLVACIEAFATGGAPSISTVKTGSSTDNWAQAATVAAGSDTNVWIYADPYCTSSTTVTVTTAATATIIQGYVYEITGLATSSPVDVVTTGSGSGTTWSSGTSESTTQADEAWIGFTGGIGSTSPTITGPGSPWTGATQQNTVSGANHCCSVTGYQFVSSTGTVTYSGTANGSGFTSAYGAIGVAFKSVSSSPASGVLLTFY